MLFVKGCDDEEGLGMVGGLIRVKIVCVIIV